MYMCMCVHVCLYVYMYMYIYIYVNLNTTIEIGNRQTERTNCFRRKYLFHIVVKSLTRILYRSMPSEDICNNEKNFR